MFYWSYKGIHVVLTDEEEMSLVRKLAPDPEESIEYLRGRNRKRIERRVFRYFKQCLQIDPEAFHKQYVFRSCYGEEAQEVFPVLLDAYGRITRRATIGFYGEKPALETLVEKVYYRAGDPVMQITLFERRRWPWPRLEVSGHISIPLHAIDKVAGAADDFFVATSAAVVRFHKSFVRISILDRSQET